MPGITHWLSVLKVSSLSDWADVQIYLLRLVQAATGMPPFVEANPCNCFFIYFKMEICSEGIDALSYALTWGFIFHMFKHDIYTFL